jgi:hypothetical protein
MMGNSALSDLDQLLKRLVLEDLNWLRYENLREKRGGSDFLMAMCVPWGNYHFHFVIFYLGSTVEYNTGRYYPTRLLTGQVFGS